MKYGMPTLVECKDITECAELAGSLGLDFVEINMSFPQYQTDSLNVDRLKKLAEDNGIFYTIHADEQLNPFDFNKKVSDCYFDVMRECIRFAKSLSIPVINMHLLKGVYVTLPGQVILLSDVYLDDYITRVRDFIAMCEAEIGDSSLKIAIENVDANPFTSSQVKALKYFMASSVFGLTLDIGHDTCMDGADRFVFEKYPDKLIHLHLHDSNGKSAHLPLGSGIIDTGATLDMLKCGETCLVEVKTIDGLKQSIVYLKESGAWR